MLIYSLVFFYSGGGFMPFPFFGFGGGSGEQQPSDQQGDTHTPPPPSNDPSIPPQQQAPPSQYGQEDGWLTDEEAGVSSPNDFWSGFFDDE